MLSIPTNSLKILWLSGKGARKQVELLSNLYISIHAIQYGLIFDNNYRVNYLCYLDAKGEPCKEEKLQKSRKETPFMESMRIAAGKQQGRD